MKSERTRAERGPRKSGGSSAAATSVARHGRRDAGRERCVAAFESHGAAAAWGHALTSIAQAHGASALVRERFAVDALRNACDPQLARKLQPACLVRRKCPRRTQVYARTFGVEETAANATARVEDGDGEVEPVQRRGAD